MGPQDQYNANRMRRQTPGGSMPPQQPPLSGSPNGYYSRGPVPPRQQIPSGYYAGQVPRQPQYSAQPPGQQPPYSGQPPLQQPGPARQPQQAYPPYQQQRPPVPPRGSCNPQGYYAPPARPVPPVPQKPRKKFSLLWLIPPLVALLVFLCVSVYHSETQRVTAERHEAKVHAKVDPCDGVFCPGVYVDGIHLGGMTPQEALEAVESRIRQRSDAWRVRLTYGANYKEITSDMINFTTDVNGVLLKAWQQGHTGDTEQRYADMLQLEQTPYNGYTAQPTGDTRVIDEILATIKSLVDTPAKDARMVGINRDNISDPFIFEEEQYGLCLNTEKLRERLYQMVSAMESGSLEIVPDPVEPAVHKADLMEKYTLRSSASTKIHTSSTENRNNNIRHALTDFVNGYCLEPGQSFSFNKVVGERTEARGFFAADEIVSGEMVEGYGGGVCQASTTIYQAAVCAGLQIVKRQPHSEKVRYTDLGLDATVYLSKNRNKDLVFKNTTNSNIYIFAVVERDPEEKSKKRLRARVDIYGENQGDTWYRMESEIVETIEPAGSEVIRDKKGQYVVYKDDPLYLYSEAQPGYQVNVYLVETHSGQRIWLYTDEYPSRKAVYYEGVKSR